VCHFVSCRQARTVIEDAESNRCRRHDGGGDPSSMTFDNRNYIGRGPGPIGCEGCASSTWSNIAIGRRRRAGQVNHAAWRSHARAPIKYEDLDVHPLNSPNHRAGQLFLRKPHASPRRRPRSPTPPNQAILVVVPPTPDIPIITHE
jgi:hypothetical protein